MTIKNIQNSKFTTEKE